MTNLLSDSWPNRLNQFEHLWVAFSGGLDSLVLLHALNSYPELASKIIAIHVNHQLQPQSEDWQNQCRAICQQWRVRFIVRKVEINSNSNVEANARRARYDVFKDLIGEDDALITAHHADDQVETFFLNLFRGAGVTGLASMPESQPFAAGVLLRPLLQNSRQSLLTYAKQWRLTWVDDPSNADCRYQRNWLRHQLLPLIRQRWPKAPENVLRSVSHIQQAYQMERSSTATRLNNCLETANRLAIEPLLNLTGLEQANVLRYWLKQHHISMPTKVQLEQLIQSVINAKQDADPSWQIDDYVVRRFDDRLYLLQQSELLTPSLPMMWSHFPEPLWLEQSKQHLHVNLVGGLPAFSQVEIRFRQGGERFHWRGKTRVLKKLLQQWKIPPWQRDRLPLLFVDQELVAIADYAVCDQWQPVMLPLTFL